MEKKKYITPVINEFSIQFRTGLLVGSPGLGKNPSSGDSQGSIYVSDGTPGTHTDGNGDSFFND